MWASGGLCAVSSCPGDWLKGAHRIQRDFLCDFWEREYDHPPGTEPGSMQAGAAATVLTSPEAKIVMKSS